jgi:hypothetical protein
MVARRKNGVWYEGRLINNNGQCKLSTSKAGGLVLDLVVAEQFQERNDKCAPEFRDATKAATDYVNTTTAWHKVRVFGKADNEVLLALVTDPKFNHGCVVTVDATYREESPWTTKDGVLRAGRQEQVFLEGDDGGLIEIKALDDGRVLGARDEWEKPMWDGSSTLPALGGSGGGGPAAPQYGDEEGF